ncbi:hypothetical protein PC9H_001956 [Pleurotus ostreatus]|uniref:Uncharacterized protein n=1 Tax=Pleurotus ostreatus TaxID=5322 RepID=A0A8H6ZKT8_PLEOS|nr:uncharacterized protein PC9H_001956 [Pleurotus ostreatus]KAF7419369.1 hypothetical protein PC9H_001956 [Pleurotus ostreatus]
MASTNPSSESTSFSTPSALIAGETPSPMALEDSGMMAQLIASEGNCQRTNQALIGTNVSMLVLAALFLGYRYFKFKKAKSRADYDMIHPINDARAVYDSGWMSEDGAKARFTLPSWCPQIFSKPWRWRTRGERSKEGAAEEGKLPLSSNNDISSSRERRSDAVSLVSALIQVSDQHSIGPVDTRRPSADEDETTNLAPRLISGNGDRRSRGQAPHVPDSAQTIAVSSSREVEPVTTHPFSENGREGTATATTPGARAHHHEGLRKSFPFVSAPVGTAPPSSFPSLDIQGTDPRDAVSRSSTASIDISSVPAEGGISPTPSIPPSAYDPHLLRKLTPSGPALPSTDGGATPATLRGEGRRTGLMSSYAPAARTSTLQSTWSDSSSTPSVPSFKWPVHSEGGSATPAPSSPPSLYGHDWLRVASGPALFNVPSAAAPSSADEGGTTPTPDRPSIAVTDPRYSHTVCLRCRGHL